VASITRRKAQRLLRALARVARACADFGRIGSGGVELFGVAGFATTGSVTTGSAGFSPSAGSAHGFAESSRLAELARDLARGGGGGGDAVAGVEEGLCEVGHLQHRAEVVLREQLGQLPHVWRDRARRGQRGARGSSRG
jgi:hypothetical protein